MLKRKRAVILTATFTALVIAALAVATARAAVGNSSQSLAKVELLIEKLHLKPYKTEKNVPGPISGTFFTCRYYDDAPAAASPLFNHHFRICTKQGALIVPKKKAADQAAS